MRWAIAVVLTVVLSAEASQAQTFPRCAARFGPLLTGKVFAQYPAYSTKEAKPAVPDVRNGLAHYYRWVLREAAKRGPDFAGKYQIVRIGGGAASSGIAILDTKTGKVFFPPALREVEALLVDAPEPDINDLNYRRTSRLLIVIGTINAKRKSVGASYFLWSRDKLTRIKFVPAWRLCGLPANTEF